MPYFNTTNLVGEELKLSTQKAETQTEKVLAYFEKYSTGRFSPSQVHLKVNVGSPITSTRRAISDLTKEGKLEKTKYKEEGIYGKPEYMWQLAFKTQLF